METYTNKRYRVTLDWSIYGDVMLGYWLPLRDGHELVKQYTFKGEKLIRLVIETDRHESYDFHHNLLQAVIDNHTAPQRGDESEG